MPTKIYFGGSFNPIHNGHLMCAQAVAEKGGYDEIVLIPSGQPPHKSTAIDLAPAADRLAMCSLAAQTAGGTKVVVDDIETRRVGPSYTIDTAQELRKRDGLDETSGKIDWLIGADMLLYLPKWHRPLDLLRVVNFVIMHRPGWDIDWSAIPAGYRHLKAHLVEAPLIPITATEIRARVKRGEPIDELVPATVAQYIGEHELYRWRIPPVPVSTGPAR